MVDYFVSSMMKALCLLFFDDWKREESDGWGGEDRP